MKILLVEESSAATDFLIRDLRTVTATSIEHANTLDEGLRKIDQLHGACDIVLYTVESLSSDALVFPKRVRAIADRGLFRCPHFILLTSAPLTLPHAARFIDLQVAYLLREFPKQIIESVRVLLWKIRTSRPGPTIRVEFCGGHYRFFVCGITTSEQIAVSRQIGRLLLLLLRGTYPVDMLAEELGVLPKTVKKYVQVLRLIIRSLLREMNISEPNADIVWMKRSPGGTMCGLRANTVWA